ncbi:uncharacterized protein LOC101237803 [Hydra vulgaris]|uniref:uncharacterized protein LOC101237803 n=1 Tax=Hydra vulgaris TaxID=6087 RepID=UPI0002B493EB|nr:uncharacterized protein LOC101237803 [Hydra vulgaris]
MPACNNHFNLAFIKSTSLLFRCRPFSNTICSYKHISKVFFSKNVELKVNHQVKFFSGISTQYSNTNLQYLGDHKLSSSQISDSDFRLVYEGPLSKKIKLIKLFSMSTSVLSLICAPVLVLSNKSEATVFLKVFLASTVVTIGLSTTFLLHWLTRVYVHKMFFHPESATFAVETFNFFGMTTRRRFSVSEFRIPEVESAFSTFEANNKKYFLHTDLNEVDQILKYVKEHNTEQMQKK